MLLGGGLRYLNVFLIGYRPRGPGTMTWTVQGIQVVRTCPSHVAMGDKHPSFVTYQNRVTITPTPYVDSVFWANHFTALHVKMVLTL